jgi:hypothetical protein
VEHDAPVLVEVPLLPSAAIHFALLHSFDEASLQKLLDAKKNKSLERKKTPKNHKKERKNYNDEENTLQYRKSTLRSTSNAEEDNRIPRCYRRKKTKTNPKQRFCLL